MSVSGFLDKFKRKWGISSSVDIILILVVFSLAGMSIVQVRVPVFNLLGLEDANWGIKTLVYLAVVFPAYQFFLLFYGFILGQFGFFWEKEKKMGRWIMNLLSKNSSSKKSDS
ncbi:MAG: hypothetical protein COB85_09525 [Bacteroidetes bacterium]|nr:MAG: hypothetical protein COB85_09525 [Bacteroidota bacterium]